MIQRLISNFYMKVKRKGIILFAIALVAILMVGMLVSCTTVVVEDGTNTSSQQEETNTQTGRTGSDASHKTKTDSGSYVGQGDNSSIEIRISGVQDDNLAFRVFKISDEARPTFERLSLKEDDEVKFDYYEETIGQPVLTKIEKISNNDAI